MRTFIKAVLVLVSCTPIVVLAHHSHANLNREDVRVYTGVVAKYGWNMPHVYMKVQGVDPAGKVVDYVIEMGNPSSMVKQGWSKTTFKPGDRITWGGAHDRNPSRHYTGLTWVEREDGSRVGRLDTDDSSLQASTDFSGLWKRSDPGGFKPHYAPPEGWAMTAAGQEIVDSFHEDQNPIIECINPGPPKSMLLPYPIQFSRPDEKTIVIERELMEELRYVHLDRDAPAGEPSRIGHSVGWLEGDDLVVETTNFLADRWGSHTGIDSSDQKHLLERYTLSEDGLALSVAITITDPIYLAEPVTFSHHWVKIADRDVVQAPCTIESSALYKEGATASR
jgi:hypothetical protein